LQTADKSNRSAGRSIIRYTRHALDGADIHAHLSAGKYPTRLGLTWNDRIAFVLTETLQVKRVEFLEMTGDSAHEAQIDAAEKFDIDFTVMCGELAKLLADLVQSLGGEILPQQQAAAA
jgi:recombination associated protein RdgC